ncbi:MAG: TdeIII family type II restriction endonuclease [Ruminococcus sp.]|nr:TdeIII family type II restriction endonuclease [Ruminococcus sp.]
MDQYYIDLIANEYRNCVHNTIDRIYQKEQTYRPFHSALLSDDVIFWSGFERSFSTSFGQRVVEELAKIVALANGAEQARR